MDKNNEKNWRHEKRKSKTLSENQKKSLRKYAKVHSFKAQLIVALLLDTGMRVGDLVRVKWTNVSFEEGVLNFKSEKTGYQIRTNVMKSTLELLKNWKDVSEDGRIIPVTTATIRNIIKKVAKDAGISRPVSPHDLCATAIQTGLIHGLPPKVAEAQYGRTGQTISKHYQVVPPDFQDKEFRKAFEN